MLRGSDVPAMMVEVQTALARRHAGARSGLPVFIESKGYDEFGIYPLGRQAHLATDFHPASARPLLGPLIGLLKRLVKRALRWYVEPVARQQSGFNLAVLGALERVAQDLQHLKADLALLREAPPPFGESERLLEQLRADVRGLREILSPGAGAPMHPRSGPPVGRPEARPARRRPEQPGGEGEDDRSSGG